MKNHMEMSKDDVIKISGEIVLMTKEAYDQLCETLDHLEKMHTEEYCSICSKCGDKI